MSHTRNLKSGPPLRRQAAANEQAVKLLLPIEIVKNWGRYIDGEVGYQVVQREKDELLYGLVVEARINNVSS